jgi:signal transduction histidine kinase
MKLSSIFKTAVHKRLVTVDLPDKGSHQHELNGVTALKTFFGTEGKTEGTLHWYYFPDDSESVSQPDQFTFYDARARSSATTGRSEWRFYYYSNFLRRAQVGDLFVLARTSLGELHGLLFPGNSASCALAEKLFGLSDQPLKFDIVSREAMAVTLPAETVACSFADYLETLSKHAPEVEADATSSLAEFKADDAQPERCESLPFKPRARILMLLGDQLIRDSGIAVFELVKNAYDADATHARVTLAHVRDPMIARVIIEDDGVGMSWDKVVNVWLEPGTDHRQDQKRGGFRTPRFHRLPLGEKGVGRFAVHKIGKKIQLVTRQRNSLEVLVEIDWNRFATERYLEDAEVKVSQRRPEYFTGDATGTRIEISDLNEELSRGVVRQIFRAVTSISSPFQGPQEFCATVELVPSDTTTTGLLNIDSVLECAPYRASCVIESGQLTYSYEFQPPDSSDRVIGRRVNSDAMPLPGSTPKSLFFEESDFGRVSMDFRIYDLDSHVLSFSVSDKKGFRDILKRHGGVRVYRDGVRVYDYGEPGNDWLDLGGSRVNDPGGKVSVNQIIAAVHLDGQCSHALIEKTNREGFIENAAFFRFQEMVRFALQQVIFERNQDKAKLRQLYRGNKRQAAVTAELAELRAAIEKYPMAATDLLPLVDRVEAKYVEMRDTLMTAAGAGLTLSIVIHEVEKGISSLSRAVERKSSLTELRDLAVHLDELVDGLTYLTRKSGRRSEKFGDLIAQTIKNTNYRTRAHRILVVNGIFAGDPDCSAVCSKRLIIATLMNLMDNSIYWLSTRNGIEKRIYLGATRSIAGGPVLFVADNGPGFQDDPGMLVQPFMSRKPDGMGLGLHVASTVMESHDGGRLVFPTGIEIGLDERYCGAIVGLQFRELQ